MTDRIYLFVFLLVYFGIVFVFRSFMLWKRTGLNPMTFDGEDDAHGFNGRLFKVIVGLELIVVTFYAFGGERSEYLLPFWYLQHPAAKLIGWLLMHAALIWTFVAQLQMSDSWRIGIDKKHPTELITHGLFSVSRNPIFLGIVLTNVGLFLVAPNAFTLLVFALSYTAIETQIRLEESFLVDEHGSQYRAYRQQVRRWI